MITRKRRGRGEGSVFQRADGLWAASVRIGFAANGKPRRRTVYGQTKAEVMAKLKSLNNDTGHIDASRLTVATFLQRWLLETVKLSRSPNTFRSYEGIIRVHIEKHLGGVRLQALEPMHLQSLYSALEKDGASARVRQLAHAIMHKAFAQAVKWRMLRYNPADAVDRPRVAKKEMHCLSQGQTQALLATAQPNRLYALIVLAVATGMRQGELFGLAWTDLDLAGASVFVQRTLEEIDGRFRLKEPKSAKSRRRIELPSFAVEALREHQKRMLADGLIAAPVFCDHKGGFLRKSNFVRQVFKPMLKRAGLPDVRFHDLRHGHATLLLTLGENPKVVQERLGHAGIAITLDTYSHVLPSVQLAAAGKIDKALRKVAEGG